MLTWTLFTSKLIRDKLIYIVTHIYKISYIKVKKDKILYLTQGVELLNNAPLIFFQCSICDRYF